MDFDLLLARDKQERHKELQDYFNYIGYELEIDKRRFEDKTKINNKIRNQFRTEIVDQVTGYLFGNPVTYEIDDDSEQKRDYFRRFRRNNMIEDLDAETGVFMAAVGRAVRLAYMDLEGNERLMNLKPWEVSIYKDDEGETQYAVREYKLTDIENVTHRYIEVYDSEEVVTYRADAQWMEISRLPHGFDYTPVWEILNNEQKQSDFERVDSLIDAYDRLISDAQNELEEFRLSYMYYKGFSLGDTRQEAQEAAKQARQSGGWEIPQEGDIGFITKDVNDTFIENHKKTLRENIYKFSRTVDMSDENFSGGSQSGESRKWKLLALENRAIMKERKFVKALRYQWKVLTSAWRRRGIDIDPLGITAQFSRNIPVELLHEAEIQQKLAGLVSTETRLSLLSAVDDPQEEWQRMLDETDPFEMGDVNDTEIPED